MEVCAIIPARGGSKGISRKNLQCVGGKTLIVRTIEAAIKSEYVNRIIVSTDDKEIFEVAQTNGSEVIDRPGKISGDDATSESVLLDVLGKLKKRENYFPDITIFLQCTSPFTIPEDIDGTISTLIDNKADSAFTAADFHHFIWKKNDVESMVGINHNEKELRKPRQSIETQFLEAGSVYAFKTKRFLKEKNRFFGKVVFHTIPAERVFEIDNEEELKQANIIVEDLSQ